MWETLGLTGADQAVYRCEVMRPGGSEQQVATATGLPVAVVRSSRRRLLACGLLEPRATGQVTATPASLAHTMRRLRRQLKGEYARRSDDLISFQSDMMKLLGDRLLPIAAFRPGVERLPGAETAVVRTAVDYAMVARHEIAWAGGRRVTGSALGLTAAVLANAARRGVTLRAVHPLAERALAKGDVHGYGPRRMPAGEFAAGVQVRVTRLPPVELILLDRKVGLLSDGTGRDEVLLVRDPTLVRALCHLFEAWWGGAVAVRPLAGRSGADGSSGTLAEQDRVLVELLRDGMKDEAVAQRLGLSVRTVRRRVADLLLRLSASSRFQAGVLAARRGWV